MELDGIHHITCITADAPRNVEFYAGLLGMRLVKKSVNQDDPTVYHLFYADEKGSAGSDLTFFEYPNAAPGRAGDGMVHRIVFRIASEASLDFWEDRLGGHGVATSRSPDRINFSDFENLDLEFRIVETSDAPLRAKHPEIPEEHALLGFDGVRAYTSNPSRSEPLLKDTLGFRPGDEPGDVPWTVGGSNRHSFYVYDEAPSESGRQGAGSVHHVAFASPMDQHEAWRARVDDAGASVTPVIDRFYFRSIYFREPSGVLFEIATLGPGFAVDEDADKLGEGLALPPDYEHLRDQLVQVLKPLPNPRSAA